MKYIKLFEGYMKRAYQEILDGYLEAALWSSGEEFDEFSIYDIDEKSIDEAHLDIENFVGKAGDLLVDFPMGYSQIGHDFWLTRNGHGAGFWDRKELEDGLGEKLTKISKEFPEKTIYEGDDGKIYID